MGFRSFETSEPGLMSEGLQFLTVKSAALGHRADITLFVPDAAQAGHNLPLCVLMHGVYGSHWAWAFKGSAHRTAARLMAEQRVPPMVLAMPSDGLWGDGSGYVPHRARHGTPGAAPDFERWIMDEVPEAARRACPALRSDAPLLLAGLSMGGYAALRLAGRHRERVTAAAGLSSATRAEHFDALLEEGRATWSDAPEDRSVLAAWSAPGSARRPALYFACGSDDPFLADNRRLHAELLAGGWRHEYAEHPGGHDWHYWTIHLEEVLLFFAATLNAAAFAEGHP